jgi:hypothetical protein
MSLNKITGKVNMSYKIIIVVSNFFVIADKVIGGANRSEAIRRPHPAPLQKEREEGLTYGEVGEATWIASDKPSQRREVNTSLIFIDYLLSMAIMFELYCQPKQRLAMVIKSLFFYPGIIQIVS